MNHTLYYFFGVDIKYCTISLCAYTIFYMALPQKPPARRNAAVSLCLFLCTVGISLLRDWIHPFQGTVTIVIFALTVCVFLKIRLKEAAALSLISLGGSYASYFMAVMAGSSLIGCIDKILFPDSMYILQMIKGNDSLLSTLSFLVISLLQILLLFLFLRTNRIKKGLAAIFIYGSSTGGLFVSLMLMIFMTCFTFLSFRYPTGEYTEFLLPLGFVCVFTLIF